MLDAFLKITPYQVYCPLTSTKSAHIASLISKLLTMAPEVAYSLEYRRKYGGIHVSAKLSWV